jgi:hypothetical protein
MIALYKKVLNAKIQLKIIRNISENERSQISPPIMVKSVLAKNA